MANTLVSKVECDVLVIGGGPAGSSAALAAAESGVNTILVEKRPVIGTPVLCAEAVGDYLLERLPFGIPDEFCTRRLKGMRLVLEGHVEERQGGIWESRALDRQKFDLWLAEKAKTAGARILTDTSLESLEFKNGKAVAANIKERGIAKKIVPKIVIAADGGESKVREQLVSQEFARKAGVRASRPEEFAETYSVKITTEKTLPPFDYLFLDSTIAPAGYGYVFVTSEHTANVGVGSAGLERPIRECFAEFMKQPLVNELLEQYEVLETREKRIPFAEAWAPLHASNILFAGDAANVVLKPLMEGILPAIISGSAAGKLAADSLREGTPLSEYPRLLGEALPEIGFSDELMGIMKQAFSRDGPERQRALYAIILLSGDLEPQNLVQGIMQLDKVATMSPAELEREVARLSVTPARALENKTKRKNV